MRMKTKGLIIAVLSIMVVTQVGKAQIYATNGPVVQPYAGSGFSGYLDGTGAQTMFASPSQIVGDTSGNLFVLDIYTGDFLQVTRALVRKISPDRVVSTFAGGAPCSAFGCVTTAPGSGTNVSIALFYSSGVSMAMDRQGTLWITPVLLAGSQWGLLRIETNGYASVAARFDPPVPGTSGVCADAKGNIYYPAQNRIYRLQAGGASEVFVGSGNVGAIDGNGIFSSFSQPDALASDAADNIYVWDSGNRLIRRISQNRDVVTVAGNTSPAARDLDGVRTNASFKVVNAMCVDGWGSLALACSGSIRKMSAVGIVTTVAGSFTTVSGYAEGTGSLARFSRAKGICAFQETLFVADTGNYRIRDIVSNPVSQAVSGADLSLNVYPGLSINGLVGRTYQIQSATDMQNTWQIEATLLLNESPYLWLDKSAFGQQRYYRAFLLP
jgi:hypothetical protein